MNIATWDTDKIIGTGLVLSLIIYMIIVGVVTILKDTVLPLDVASNIAVGLTGYMGRSLVEKLKKPNPDDTPDKKI